MTYVFKTGNFYTVRSSESKKSRYFNLPPPRPPQKEKKQKKQQDLKQHVSYNPARSPEEAISDQQGILPCVAF